MALQSLRLSSAGFFQPIIKTRLLKEGKILPIKSQKNLSLSHSLQSIP
jgi:hypothetical protein